MDSIISQFQSAFILGRLFTDNILIAFEINHFLHAPGADGGLSIKLDMAKAFDRVEWPFLFEALGNLGFAVGFISLIKMCISSSSLSFLINRERVGVVRPSRGLRQGDFLSPYLFIMCSEFLSRILARVELNGRILGIAVAPSAPRISHLLFADDTLIFYGANRSEAEAVSHILGTFAAASGLIINFSKSSLMISRSVCDGIASEIVTALGIPRCDSHELYLGVPASVGRNRYASFKFIKDHIWNRIQGWKVKFLSRAGREILIKVVLTSIPAYVMSCFRLPKSLFAEINSILAGF
ncbi:hypothetical protein KSP39_PZI017944 [Platanthera zijinensis]|uniref:Reverse transcriptase domain-containing protein n=1 Tax=Platanthera zijinensis TaxID=2320716 RepID=A0AAP0B544_9ASPA